MLQEFWIGDYYLAGSRDLTPNELTAVMRCRLKYLWAIAISLIPLPVCFLLAGLASELKWPDSILIPSLLGIPIGMITAIAGVALFWTPSLRLQKDSKDKRVLRFHLPGTEPNDAEGWLEILSNSQMLLTSNGIPQYRLRRAEVTRNAAVYKAKDHLLPHRLEVSPKSGELKESRFLTPLECHELLMLSTNTGNTEFTKSFVATAFAMLAFVVIWGVQWPPALHVIEAPICCFAAWQFWQFLRLKLMSTKLRADLKLAFVERLPSIQPGPNGEAIYMEVLPKSRLLWCFHDIPGPVRRASALQS